MRLRVLRLGPHSPATGFHSLGVFSLGEERRAEVQIGVEDRGVDPALTGKGTVQTGRISVRGQLHPQHFVEVAGRGSTMAPQRGPTKESGFFSCVEIIIVTPFMFYEIARVVMSYWSCI